MTGSSLCVSTCRMAALLAHLVIRCSNMRGFGLDHAVVPFTRLPAIAYSTARMFGFLLIHLGLDGARFKVSVTYSSRGLCILKSRDVPYEPLHQSSGCGQCHWYVTYGKPGLPKAFSHAICFGFASSRSTAHGCGLADRCGHDIGRFSRNAMSIPFWFFQSCIMSCRINRGFFRTIASTHGRNCHVTAYSHMIRASSFG